MPAPAFRREFLERRKIRSPRNFRIVIGLAPTIDSRDGAVPRRGGFLASRLLESLEHPMGFRNVAVSVTINIALILFGTPRSSTL
jgi:hypothetical protein